MKYSEIQDRLKEFKAQGLTSIKLNSSFEVLETELERLTTPIVIDGFEITVANGGKSEQVGESTTLECEEKCQPFKQYRMDNDEKEGDEWWLEELNSEGEPTEDYVSVDDDQLEQLKSNGQIWEYVKGDERWFPPNSDAGKISQPETDEPEILYDYDEEDATEDKLDDFLDAVRGGQLNKEQLEAVALAMTVAHEKHQNLSITLAQLRKFQMFTPSQLLAWGFDEVIPAEGLFLQFKRAVMTQVVSQTEVSVNVRFFEFEAGNNVALLCAWATSYSGKNWSSGSSPGYRDEDWSFSNLESAKKFVEYCQKLEFVMAVKIDRIAANVIIPVELGLAIA